METATLYTRLGKTEGIAAIVEDIVDAHTRNPVIAARFLPYTEQPARLAELKGLLVRFLVTGSGGPQEYDGRSMLEAHKGLNVSDAEYMAAIDDIMQVLAKHDVDEATQKDVLFISYGLKKEIVNV